MAATDYFQRDFGTDRICGLTYGKYTDRIRNGFAGFVGQIAAYGAMIETGMSSKVALIQIILMHFVLPAVVTFDFLRRNEKAGWIKDGDMKLEV